MFPKLTKMRKRTDIEGERQLQGTILMAMVPLAGVLRYPSLASPQQFNGIIHAQELPLLLPMAQHPWLISHIQETHGADEQHARQRPKTHCSEHTLAGISSLPTAGGWMVGLLGLHRRAAWS